MREEGHWQLERKLWICGFGDEERRERVVPNTCGFG